MKPIKPHVIGVIGGSGTGKTFFAKYAQTFYKSAFIEGDAIGHQALKQGPIIESVRQIFGEQVISGGGVDRRKLGNIVFSNEDRLLELNSIMHPYMYRMIEDDIQKINNKFVILEAAVMIEAKFYELTDTMIYIKADDEVRMDRLVRLRGIDKAKAAKMIDLGRSDYRDYSDYIIDTSFGLEAIQEDVDRVLRQIMEAANE